MGKYKIVFGRRIDRMVQQHVAFLSRVSIPAAKQFRKEFGEILSRIEENPFQFSASIDEAIAEAKYREAAFAKRYKAIFSVDESTVFLDAVLDCRMDNRGVI